VVKHGAARSAKSLAQVKSDPSPEGAKGSGYSSLKSTKSIALSGLAIELNLYQRFGTALRSVLHHWLPYVAPLARDE